MESAGKSRLKLTLNEGKYFLFKYFENEGRDTYYSVNSKPPCEFSWIVTDCILRTLKKTKSL